MASRSLLHGIPFDKTNFPVAPKTFLIPNPSKKPNRQQSITHSSVVLSSSENTLARAPDPHYQPVTLHAHQTIRTRRQHPAEKSRAASSANTLTARREIRRAPGKTRSHARSSYIAHTQPSLLLPSYLLLLLPTCRRRDSAARAVQLVYIQPRGACVAAAARAYKYGRPGRRQASLLRAVPESRYRISHTHLLLHAA